MTDLKSQLMDAVLLHVPFDGWSETSFRAAVSDVGADMTTARAVCPRGSLDLAIAYHKSGDQIMLDRLAAEDLLDMRFRDKVATAVRFRLEAVDDKEVVRRGTTLFSLPHYAPEGAKLIWDTSDEIWTALGDTSDDVNWYTKRATLAGVYSSTVLFWLGDDSLGNQATWEFLDRRIDDIMKIEKLKATVRKSRVLSKLLAGPTWLAGQIKAPGRTPPSDLPGSWAAPRD